MAAPALYVRVQGVLALLAAGQVALTRAEWEIAITQRFEALQQEQLHPGAVAVVHPAAERTA